MSDVDPSSIPQAIPIAVQALPYSLPFQRGRPGIISAIGVLCIIIACLSGIFSFGAGMYSFGFYVMSKASARMSSASSTSWTATSSMTTNSTPSSAKLSPAETSVAVNVLRSDLGLDASHVREVDRFLRLHGRQVFAIDENTRLTTADVQIGVTSGKPQPTNSTQPATFTTALGTVEVFSEHAVFNSADGSTTIRTSARNHSDQTTESQTTSGGSAAVAPSTPNTTLTKAQIKSVVAAVQSSGQVKLNSAQLAALKTALAAPNQTLVTPGASTPVTAVYTPSLGNVAISFDTGNVLVLSQTGTVVSSGGPAMPNFNISGRVAAADIIEAIGSIGLAIYLLIVGIMVVRASFKARRLLLIYACLKIPFALAAGAGLALLAYQFATGITSSTTGTPPASQPFVIWGIIVAVLGLAFPIGLLIALNTRMVREYYNAVGVGE